jgi:hypothetical protein
LVPRDAFPIYQAQGQTIHPFITRLVGDKRLSANERYTTLSRPINFESFVILNDTVTDEIL